MGGNHDETYKRAHAERNILKVLEGDCETAIGAHSIICLLYTSPSPRDS